MRSISPILIISGSFRAYIRLGFIKAFSQSPTALQDVNRAMRMMFLTDLNLWPRFHSDIANCFKEARTPQVIELRMKMTQDMR